MRARRRPARRAFFTERGYTPTVPIDRYERNLRRIEDEPVFLPTHVVHPAQGGQNLEAELLFRALRSEGLLPARARPR